MWSTDPSRSPTTLAATEIRLRRHVRPFFGDRAIEAIQPMLIRQWQNQLPGKLSHESLMACRSILFRILQLAEGEGAITTNSLPRVPPPKRRADPDAMALRVVEAIQARLTVALRVAEEYTPADQQGTWRVF